MDEVEARLLCEIRVKECMRYCVLKGFGFARKLEADVVQIGWWNACRKVTE